MFAEVVELYALEQYGTLLGRCCTLVGLADDDAIAFELHILLLDDDLEFVDLLFELLYATIKARYLLRLYGDNLVGALELCAISLGSLFALLRLEEDECAKQSAGQDEV